MSPVLCLRHRAYWLASCDECREARRATLLLPTVQSCTVHNAARASDQGERLPSPAGRPLVLLRRTRP